MFTVLVHVVLLLKHEHPEWNPSLNLENTKFFAFKMEKVPESSIHFWMIRKMKKFGWGFSKVILFISCWDGVSVFLSYWTYVMLRRWAVKGRFSSKVFHQSNSKLVCVYGLQLYFVYARYCIVCCRWELHFPWCSAMECTCGIDGSCRN